MITARCVGCGTKNRIPESRGADVRCAKCKRVFKMGELVMNSEIVNEGQGVNWHLAPQRRKGIMIATCSCGAKNRLPPVTPDNIKRVRCGACKKELTIQELSSAVREKPTAAPMDLEREIDGPTWQCTDDDCGWEGAQGELDMSRSGKARCPECGSRVAKEDDEDEEDDE